MLTNRDAITDDTDDTADEPASKAEFVWLMIELNRLAPDQYKELRDRAWEQIALIRMMFGQSVSPN